MKKLILTSAVLFITISTFAKKVTNVLQNVLRQITKNAKDATCSKTKSTTDAMLKEDKHAAKR
ncbi:MAG: hypothetical protein IPN61_00980 [Bacteroidetes bacterium]|nr:hypothetical protein [Bacteroidota bacterium]